MSKLPWNWPELRRATFHADDYKCVQCGSRARIECDHITPREAGGTDDLDNLQTLCRECHMDKTARETGNRQPDSVLEWTRLATASPYQRRKMLAEMKD